MPDAGFYLWDHFPGKILPPGGSLGIAPDLAVEILSPSNTAGEMDLKRREYFFSGTRLYWEVVPDLRQVRVYQNPEEFGLVREDGILTGDPVLPGFRLSVGEGFGCAGNRSVPKREATGGP